MKSISGRGPPGPTFRLSAARGTLGARDGRYAGAFALSGAAATGGFARSFTVEA
jgi:hypothetical protein